MSDEESKEKRSKRLHQEQTAIKRQIQIAKTHLTPDSYIAEPHRYHKHHVMNCGNPKCHMCGNPRKLFKDKTTQELSFEQTDKWE